MVVAVFLSAATSFATSIGPRPTKDPVRVWHIRLTKERHWSAVPRLPLDAPVHKSARNRLSLARIDEDRDVARPGHVERFKDSEKASHSQKDRANDGRSPTLRARGLVITVAGVSFFCDQNHRILPTFRTGANSGPTHTRAAGTRLLHRPAGQTPHLCEVVVG